MWNHRSANPQPARTMISCLIGNRFRRAHRNSTFPPSPISMTQQFAGSTRQANTCLTARTPRSHRAPVDRTDRRRHPAGARSSGSKPPLHGAQRSPASRRPVTTTIVASCAPGVSPQPPGEMSAFVRSRRELSFAPPSGLSSTADRLGSKRSNSKGGALPHGRNVAFVVQARACTRSRDGRATKPATPESRTRIRHTVPLSSLPYGSHERP